MVDDKRRADKSSARPAVDGPIGRPTTPLVRQKSSPGNAADESSDAKTLGDAPTMMPRHSQSLGDAPTIMPRDSRSLGDVSTIPPRQSRSLGDASTMLPRESRRLDEAAVTSARAAARDSAAITRQSAKALHEKSLGDAPTVLPQRRPGPSDEATMPPTRQTVDITGRDAPTRPSMRGAPVKGDTSSSLRGGDLVGRYVVLGIIGAGGMGIVYLAYDPELDRRVALKVLRPEFSHLDTVGPSLLQEAKSMARLSDPNVCTVYEVGQSDKAVFIAMEYVDGETMSDWLEAEPRTWRDVIDVMVQAGRGLEAAHRNGIVHRDFKPDNIMIDSQGRVRVMDFGVSERAVRKPGTRPDLQDDDIPRRDSFSSLIVGTPGYMAPEQLNAQPVDQRCDQFSYCATLFKTLYGELPYQGNTLRELREAFQNGDLTEPENHHGVPHWLRQIILRGLSIDPDKRFSSVGALVKRMLQVPRQRRNIAIGVLSALILLTVVATTVLLAGRQATTPRPCQGANDRVATVWNDEVRAKVKSGIMASGLPNAERMSKLVDDNMTRYTNNWVTMHTDACQATRVRGEQSAEMLDLRVLCLDSRLREVKALSEVLAEADREVAQRGAEAVLTLSDLSRCQARESLLMADPEPEDAQVRKRLDELREVLASVKARYDAASYRDALPLAEKLLKDAGAVDYGPLTAEANLLLGLIRGRLGDLEDAENILLDAAVTARASGVELLEAQALIALVRYMGWEGGKIDIGRRWSRFAEAVLKRMGGDPRLEARLSRHQSALFYQEGDYQASYALNKKALDVGRRELGKDDPAVIDARINVGGLEIYLGRVDAGLQNNKQAAEDAERVLGAGHPMVAEAFTNLGHALFHKEDIDEAERYYQRARDIWAGSLGEDHPSVAVALNNLGRVAVENAEIDAAIKLYLKALHIEEARLGQGARKTASTLANLGGAYFENGDQANAQKYLERAIAIFGESENFAAADAQFVLARVLWANGDRTLAADWARKARALLARHGDKFDNKIKDIDAWLSFDE